MKKGKTILALSIILIVILSMVLIVVEYKNNSFVKRHNVESDIKFKSGKKNIYLFYGETCPHCADLEDFLGTLDNDVTKNVNFYTFEVWNNEKNNKLMKKFSDKLNANADGVPFMIIGNKYFIGYSHSDNKKIINAIKEYNSKDDVYKKLAK